MKISFFIEKSFTIFAIVFFSGTLDFKALYFSPFEGVTDPTFGYNPLTPILSLIQHSIFLVTAFFVISRFKLILSGLRTNKFLLLLIFLFLISFIWSGYPDLTLRRSISLFETTLFGVYLGSRFDIREQLQFLVIALSFISAISVIFVVVKPSQGIMAGVHAGNWRGTLEHKNFFGRLMVYSAIVFRTFSPTTKKWRQIKTIGLISSIVLVFLSGSKTALITCFLTLCLLIPFYRSFRLSFRVATLVKSTTLLVATASLSILLGQLSNIAGFLGRDLTLTGRTEIWRGVLWKLSQQPWLGFGYSGFWFGPNEGPSGDVLRYLGPGAYAPHSHNGFIELAISTGIIGLIIFTFAFLGLFKRALNYLSNTTESFGLWPVSYLSFILVYNQTEITLVEHNSVFWVTFVAIAFSNLLPLSIRAYE